MSMGRSWLIQRMQKPTGGVNPFAFGGGGSGFTKETAEQLKDVCSWDYMRAEYEFGSTSKALNRMILAKKKLKAGAFKVSYKHDRIAWGDKPAKQFVGEGKVFFLCPKKEVKEVQPASQNSQVITNMETRGTMFILKQLLQVREIFVVGLILIMTSCFLLMKRCGENSVAVSA